MTRLHARGRPFTGRVSFLPLAESEPLAHGHETHTADRWVTCDHPDLASLPRQLLGRTLIVDDVADGPRRWPVTWNSPVTGSSHERGNFSSRTAR